MEYIKFIGLLCLVYLFIEGSGPIQFLKKLLNIHNDSDSNNITLIVLKKLVNCSLCSGFWLGLLYYFELIPSFVLIASFASVSAEIFYRIYKRMTSII